MSRKLKLYDGINNKEIERGCGTGICKVCVDKKICIDTPYYANDEEYLNDLKGDF